MIQTPQDIYIRNARQLLKPTPVKVGAFPSWFSKSVISRLQSNDDLHHASRRFRVETLLNSYGNNSWLDHWGKTSFQGFDCFVSEPYNVSPAASATIDDLCKLLGVRYIVLANSWHYPGFTLRVVIYPPFGEAHFKAPGV